MRGIDRTTLLGMALCLGLLAASCLQAKSLGVDPGGEDPLLNLSPAHRSAARALGEAREHVNAGRFDFARASLRKTESLDTLAGYVELVRVRLLMSEGAHVKAYQRATAALARPDTEALRAAMGVLQGEALAMGGDAPGAEVAWNQVIETAVGSTKGADSSIRQSVELAIIASRQRTGSLDAKVDPLVLLDQNISTLVAATRSVPVDLLSPKIVLDRAQAALEAGHPAKAEVLYDQAIAAKLEPAARRTAQVGRARALFRARKYEAAAKAYQGLLPDLDARFWYARSLARNGRIEASIKEFAEVSKGSDGDLASWALYLKGTLHEDRGETAFAIDSFEGAAGDSRFPDRVRSALWRKGWVQYRSKEYGGARETFSQLATRMQDPLDQLRPRYWAARAARWAGEKKAGQGELKKLAQEYPLTYYGWRASERLALGTGDLRKGPGALQEGTRRVDDESIERAALLIEAGLDDFARDELRFAARQARGFVDRTQVGLLLARVGDYHRANRLVVAAYGDSLARGLQEGRESLWWLAWPPAYDDLLNEVVIPNQSAIEKELVWAIMREESHYQVDARSSVGALGLLQLMPTTAAELAEERGLGGFETEDLFDPRTNITLGAAYLEQLSRRFDGRLSAAIGSYNAGPRRVAQWLKGDAQNWDDDVWVENIPYDQTRAYVKRVMRSLHVYESFYRSD